MRNSSYFYTCMKIYVVRVRLNILAITSQIIMFPFSMPAIKKTSYNVNNDTWVNIIKKKSLRGPCNMWWMVKSGTLLKKNRTPVQKILMSYLGKQDFAKGQKGS